LVFVDNHLFTMGSTLSGCFGGGTFSRSSESLQSTADYEESNLSALQDQCQQFLRFALSDLRKDHLVLSFLPLPPDLLREFPGRILAPVPESNILDYEVLQRLVKNEQVVVGICNFEHEEERQAVSNIINQLRVFTSPTIIVAFLLPRGVEPTREVMDVMASRHDELMQLGVDEVIPNPKMKPGSLRLAVHLGCQTKMHVAQVIEKASLDYPDTVSPEELAELEDRERTLLWTTIPRALMPYFPRVNLHLHNDKTGVGGYRFVEEYQCVAGKVMKAMNANNMPVALKVISKPAVHSCSEVEDIYREYRFTRGAVGQHPNIVTCLDILHARDNLYIVFQQAGAENLAQYCKTKQGARLTETEAMSCFKQIVDALGWMHRTRVVHRKVSLEHVAVDQFDRDNCRCTLLDFREAIVTQDDVVSTKICGRLPCQAPEMVLARGGYIPCWVDCWSVGVLLLEAAGGLGSLFASTLADEEEEEEDLADAMMLITSFFDSQGCYRTALSALGGVKSPQILGYLEELLVMPPHSRTPLPLLSERLDANTRCLS